MFLNSIDDLVAGQVLPETAPGVSVRAACRALGNLDVGAMVVMAGDRLAGILSERDVIRRCVCPGRDADATTVAEIMTPDPVTVPRGTPVAAALELMRAGGFRHLPVMDGARPVALLSMRAIPTENRLAVERYREYRAAPEPARARAALSRGAACGR